MQAIGEHVLYGRASMRASDVHSEESAYKIGVLYN